MSHSAARQAPDLSDASLVGTRLGGWGRLAAVVGVGCLATAVFLGWRSGDTGHLARVWLQNWLFGLAIALGGLFFVFVQHLTHAGWSVAVRRPAEAIMSNLLWLWLGFLPFVAMYFSGKLSQLFPWCDLEAMRAHDPAEAALVEAKTAYLNPQFFFIRAAAYMAVWVILAFTFWHHSVRQDVDGSVARTKFLERFAAPAALLFGLSITFAAFDWIMSLSPAWFSTMFGVYFFAGCCTAGFSVIILVCLRLQQLGYLKGVITAEHYQDLGKMLFAFGIVFWAYIAFSQYMLIWYANIPEETGWYLARQLGGWGWMSLALLFGHFVIPFLFLVSRWTKRIKLWLAVGAVWMLLFSWIDLYWLVMPEIPPHLNQYETYDQVAAKYGDTSTHLADPVNWFMLVGIMGCVASFTIFRLREHPLLCRRDPRLAESLAFENM